MTWDRPGIEASFGILNESVLHSFTFVETWVKGHGKSKTSTSRWATGLVLSVSIRTHWTLRLQGLGTRMYQLEAHEPGVFIGLRPLTGGKTHRIPIGLYGTKTRHWKVLQTWALERNCSKSSSLQVFPQAMWKKSFSSCNCTNIPIFKLCHEFVTWDPNMVIPCPRFSCAAVSLATEYYA